MDNHFRVVYSGRLQPGKSWDEAIENFSKLTKQPRKTAEQFLRGDTARNIRKNIDEVTAERYRQAFSSAGLDVAVIDDMPFGQPLELEREETEPEPELEQQKSKEPTRRVLY